MTAAETPAAAMRLRLQHDLRAAMRGRRVAEVKLLRVLIAALDNAEAVPMTDAHQKYAVLAFGDGSAEVPRRVLSATDVRAILEHEQADRRVAAAELERVGRPDVAAERLAEVDLIAGYLAG